MRKVVQDSNFDVNIELEKMAKWHPKKGQFCPDCGDDMTTRYGQHENPYYLDSKGNPRPGENKYFESWACSCSDRLHRKVFEGMCVKRNGK